MSVETSKAVFDMHPMSVGFALASAVLAAIILIWFLAKRPSLTLVTKVALFFGLGAFPIVAALVGNTANFVHSKHRNFCSSCHVMLPYTQDSDDWKSKTLASRHARNAEFGDHNCYMCHQDYGMFGTVITKFGGLRHAWEYYTEYRYYSLEQAKKKIHLYKPFRNSSCTHCHSTRVPLWQNVPEHSSLKNEISHNEVSCVSDGCHGPAHPFSKDIKTTDSKLGETQ